MDTEYIDQDSDNEFERMSGEDLQKLSEETIDFGCSRHQIDYRIVCEECQSKYKLLQDWTVKTILKNRKEQGR